MDLKIIKISDIGGNDARIVVEVMSKTDIGKFMLMRVSKSEKGVSPTYPRQVFLFPPKVVEKGDYVSVFFANGDDKTFQNRRKTTTHAFYWGLKTDDVQVGDKFFLLHYDSWEVETVREDLNLESQPV